MHRIVLMLLAAALFTSPALAQVEKPADTKPAGSNPSAEDVKKNSSYGFGYRIGENVRGTITGNEFDFDLPLVLKGLSDALNGEKSAIPPEEVQKALSAFEKDHRRKMAQKAIDTDPRRKALAEKNAREGATFLKENAARKGVKSTASGLQYEVLKSGAGQSPKLADTVEAHYHGTLIDKTVFDSSVERGEPALFPVSGVIPGWTEALQLMKVGDKWRLFIPSALAYDLVGAGDQIGPNAVLIFDVELLSVKPGAAAPNQSAPKPE
jgi:FKBP-type peptidyl-prolyl cis-trans isomerase